MLNDCVLVSDRGGEFLQTSVTKRDGPVRVDRLDFRLDMPKDRRRNQGG